MSLVDSINSQTKVGREGRKELFATKRCASEVKEGKQEVQRLASPPVARRSSRGPGGPRAKEATLPAQVCSISARYQSHAEDR